MTEHVYLSDAQVEAIRTRYPAQSAQCCTGYARNGKQCALFVGHGGRHRNKLCARCGGEVYTPTTASRRALICRTCLGQKYREKYASYILMGVRSRSKQKGIPCTLTLQDLPNVPSRCPVLDIELRVPEYQPRQHGANDNSPSLDRINPKRGYVKGNVRWISYRANQLKSNGTLEEMRLVVADLERLHGDQTACDFD